MKFIKFSQHLKLKNLRIKFVDDITSRATCEALPALSATNVYQMTVLSLREFPTNSFIATLALVLHCQQARPWSMFSISVYRYVSAIEQSTAF